MQPENKATEAAPELNVAAPKEQKEEKSKMSKKQIVGLVVMCLIAIGGVLFGVYGMNSQNEQIAQLTVRATDAEGKVAELETNKITITDPNGGTAEIVDSTRKNPVITAQEPEFYAIHFESASLGYVEKGEYSLSLTVRNGEVSECQVNKVENVQTKRILKGCNISGIDGKISKVVEIGEGHVALNDSIGFIMENGEVQYFSLDDALGKSDFTIKGKIKIDGRVTDVINVNYSQNSNNPTSFYGSTVFILSDGSFIKYDESML